MKHISLAFALLVLAVSACNNLDCCSGVVADDTIFQFSLLDKQGRDLLDPQTPGSLDINAIRLYNLINSDTVMHYRSNSDAPYGYSIFKGPDSLYHFRPFFDFSQGLEITGYIRWNAYDLDTLQLSCRQENDNDRKRLIGIHYNGRLVWQEETANDPDYRYFQIVK